MRTDYGGALRFGKMGTNACSIIRDPFRRDRPRNRGRTQAVRRFVSGLQPATRPVAIDRVAGSFYRFARREASGGILLVIAALIALIWANSRWAHSYFEILETEIGIMVGQFGFSEPLHFWINDGLMAIFFFVVGLEIKREFAVGELRSPRRAMLPIAAAIGGMLVPALIYAGLNAEGPGSAGWGIPMATDIAFAVGILAVLGRRVPSSLKVFLVAVAIVDDLGAVLVIAVFYTADFNLAALGWATLFWSMMWVLWFLNIRLGLAYLLLAIPMWYALELSGVHATVAGVLAAMTIPSSIRIAPDSFLAGARDALRVFERETKMGRSVLTSRDQQQSLQKLEHAVEESRTPLQKLEHAYHPWSTYMIVPAFAFANAGVELVLPTGGGLGSIPLGIALGLILGKPAGILIGSLAAIKSGVATAPYGVAWRQFAGIGLLAGIGFTMSLFIAQLAFTEHALLEIAKLGILSGSLVSGAAGFLLLSMTPKPQRPLAVAESGGYAQSSSPS